jgi:hypothetical protein
MPVTDTDQELVVRLLIHDLHSTVGAGHDGLPLGNARTELPIGDLS